MEILVGLVVLIAVVVGVGLIVKRAALAKFMEENQRPTFGRAAKLMGRPEPGSMVVVGMVFVLIGIAIAIALVTR